MRKQVLPTVSYAPADNVPGCLAVFDREASLLVINLDKPNDYSGEFIDTGRLSISLDSGMALEDMELKFSTSDVERIDRLEFPTAIPVRLCFEPDAGLFGIEERFRTNHGMDLVHVIFADAEEDEILHLLIADGLALDVTAENELVGIWIKNVTIR
jgi:hypothetical protein